jgi:hypothetical protein
VSEPTNIDSREEVLPSAVTETQPEGEEISQADLDKIAGGILI